MSDFTDAIKKRRSTRKFLKRPVEPEAIRAIIEAATWAPSAHNAQPWRFVVLADAQSQRGLAEVMAEQWLQDLERDQVHRETREVLARESVEQFANAPVLVVACLTLEDMDQYPDKERRRCERDLAVQSLAAAVQNMLLAAHARGLASCWYCAPLFCPTAVRQTLKLPDEVEPQALIAFGYPAEQPPSPPRKPVESVVYFDRWGKSRGSRWAR